MSMSTINTQNTVEVINYGDGTASVVINGQQVAAKIVGFRFEQGAGEISEDDEDGTRRVFTASFSLDSPDDSFTYREAAEGEMPPWVD